MGQLLIRNVDDAIILRLKQKAKREGISVEQYLRNMVANDTAPDKSEILADNAARLRASGYKMKFAPEDTIREDRDR